MTVGVRCATRMAGVLVTLAIALPAAAQGKSGQAHGKKPAAPPPTTTTLPASTAPATSGNASTGPVAPSVTPAAPFAWMDDANLMAPGTVWLGVSTVSWHGGGASEVVVPVFDGSIGITPRVQFGASVPRVGGGARASTRRRSPFSMARRTGSNSPSDRRSKSLAPRRCSTDPPASRARSGDCP